MLADNILSFGVDRSSWSVELIDASSDTEVGNGWLFRRLKLAQMR